MKTDNTIRTFSVWNKDKTYGGFYTTNKGDIVLDKHDINRGNWNQYKIVATIENINFTQND